MRRSRSRTRSLRRLARPVPALLALSLLALVARLYALGWRVAHQDEGRVADWTLHYMETGIWEYRPIIHGPFLPHVNGVVFSLFGADDFTMRVVVAVFGALLPLSALLLRTRLRDVEVVALGFFLAANPVLLYYSRFFRNDLLLAGLMFVAFGFFVRAYDTRRLRHVFAGVGAFALAFTTKENALVYPLVWLGATALLLDHRVLLGRAAGDVTARLPPWLVEGARGLRTGDPETLRRLARAVGVGALALLEFLVVVVLFYAPLSRGVDRPGLFKAFGQPTMFPAVVEEALLGSWRKFLGTWGGGMQEDNSYLSYLKEFVDVMEYAAPALLVLAVVGFLLDRYANDRPRDVVAFCFYWGAASTLGYPIAVGNPFPWEVVHFLVPLAVPAAAGLAIVARRGARALADDDRIAVGAAAILVLLVVGQNAVVAYETSFEKPQSPDNKLVQYAQPSGKMQPTLREIERISGRHDGTDVLFYGDLFDDGGEVWKPDGTPPPGWFDRLPLPWYFHQYGANVSSTTNASDLETNPPPVVIALEAGAHGDPEQTAADVDRYLGSGYERHVYQQYLWSRPLVVWVREDAAESRSANATPRANPGEGAAARRWTTPVGDPP